MQDSSTIQINIQIPENFQSLLQTLVDAIQNNGASQAPPAPQNDLMTVDDLAARWGKTRSAIYQLTMQKGPGSIPRFKVGGSLRFRRSEIERWEREQVV